MRKEEAIVLNKGYITEIEQGIHNHKEVIKGLRKRKKIYEDRIAKWEKERQ